MTAAVAVVEAVGWGAGAEAATGGVDAARDDGYCQGVAIPKTSSRPQLGGRVSKTIGA